ncbi:sodium-coupled monocarboxylate transporter 2-like isoform X1 [Argiope bruennichi]|uniref:sodium-coupled monocarboxylate transporter 2-like isoform X1 n=1 Tax=Argiope bruennichi TaxID=94029 RepID=UPI0024940A89|nr:sodium-coupled monocarboxylate transporter 2-like isoform X1 [Argiope bruennichi]XP_055929195.1 sodium-coupled monocarboxylate transporter 2-like isoform X1 [Argiope bruennichi]XP_055929196.1 sodium-coupled monocarboxylate transporter 2-like isoform X1 [Argiope bruennichi]XP_055929198.1 sodium-coupled monocarboxylate transporter 2-like isoform X1 [Argiope bruennichi]XP_055929199.1 sodium-coupled monocarboxylate transporter 2-like isoform X1 [Argiope bruennichi]
MSEKEMNKRFDTADYAVCVAMLSVSAGIGVFYAITGSKHNTTKEFLFGGKNMKIIPVALSVLATFVSAITLLGVPAESYQFGIQYWLINISYCFMIPVAAHIYTPLFFKLQVSSVNEYLEKRFNRFVRTVCFVISTISQLLYVAFVIYAPSLVLSQVTGLHLWVCILSIGLVCTFYTTIGGIKAVIWTDVFQIIIIFGALITVIIKGTMDAGGIGEVWSKAQNSQRTELFNFNPDPTVRHTFWSLTIGGFFTWLSIYAVNQAMVQRSLTIPTLKKARVVIWLNLPGNIITVTLTILVGLIIYANYSTCDPIRTKQVSTPNQIFPLFVMEYLGFLPGLPGLFVSGIFSGALSTLSSSLNSLSANTLEDLVRSYISPNMNELWATRTAKLLALIYGVIAIVLVVLVQNMTGTVLQAALSISGALGGPILGVYTLGMFFPWPSAFAAISGLISGLGVCIWICVGSILYKRAPETFPLSVDSCQELYFNVTQSFANATSAPSVIFDSSDYVLPLYRLSYLWYSGIGFIVVIVVGILISLFVGNDKHTIEKKLMTPFFYNLWKCSTKEVVAERDVRLSSLPLVEVASMRRKSATDIFNKKPNDELFSTVSLQGVYRQNSENP